jgi:hypothetical protein
MRRFQSSKKNWRYQGINSAARSNRLAPIIRKSWILRNASGITKINDSRDSGAGSLSTRELSTLPGMLEGKTSHESVADMGFPVCAIPIARMRPRRRSYSASSSPGLIRNPTLKPPRRHAQTLNAAFTLAYPLD